MALRRALMTTCAARRLMPGASVLGTKKPQAPFGGASRSPEVLPTWSVLARCRSTSAIPDTACPDGQKCETTCPECQQLQSPRVTIPQCELREMRLLGDRRMVEASWDGGEKTVYPYIWLRDNCQCHSCFHPYTLARNTLMSSVPVDAEPKEIKLDAETGELWIRWHDNHESTFTSDWLYQRRFTKEAQEFRIKNYFPRTPKRWGAEMLQKLPTFDWEEVMTQDKTFYHWLLAVEDYGLALIKNTKKDRLEVKQLADRVSFPRLTHYGANSEVIARANPPNLAFTAQALGLHTDIPYDPAPPGVQVLHCIKQSNTDGGQSEFCDGLNVAEQMRQEYPDYYRILCETPVDYIDIGEDVFGAYYKLVQNYTFNRDLSGNIRSIVYSNPCRDSYLRIEPDKVEPFLRALHKFNELLYDDRNIIRYMLQDGDMITFGNDRVLHGRTEDVPAVGEGIVRHLTSIYFDWEEVYSNRRHLAEKFGITEQ